MAALTLANMLERVKRYVPTTLMDTELQDALLEKINHLASLDTFPFQEKYQYTSMNSGSYNVAVPSNFSVVKSLTVWMPGDDKKNIELMDSTEFAKMFPKPDENSSGIPDYACIRVAEGQIWFNCPLSKALTIRMDFYTIPTDATDTTVSQMTELAKLAAIDLASAEGFRMLREFDSADKMEDEGNKKLLVIRRRYELALEKDAKFTSPLERLKIVRQRKSIGAV